MEADNTKKTMNFLKKFILSCRNNWLLVNEKTLLNMAVDLYNKIEKSKKDKKRKNQK